MKLSKLKKIIKESLNTLNEQTGKGPMANLGVYHLWKHCQTGNQIVLYWNSVPNTGFPQQLGAGPNGWSMGMTVLGITATGNAPANQPWATHQNSEAFWMGMGSPNPGDTVSALIGPQNQGAPYYCWEYVGQVSSGSHGAFGGGNTISNVLVNDPLCPTNCGSVRPPDPTNDNKCTEKDFQYNATPCGQTHLVPAPGGAGSWQNWLNAQWNAYSTGVTQTGQPVGCFQFGAIITYTTNQLNSGVTGGGVPFTQVQIDRKEAKRDWAVCMVDHCDCKNINTSWGDPCDKFNAAPVSMQNGCCGKCINGVYSGTAGDPCDVLTQSCKCCPDDSGGEDVRGCLNPAQPGAINIGMPCPGSVGTVTLHHEPCCEYDDRGGDPCKTFYAMPQNYQDGCCEKCQGNISPADPCYQYCKCCDPRISDDPCKDNPNPECYWCFEETSQGGPCQPVGGNLQYALNNGITLYQDPAVCNATEPGCRRDDIDPQRVECHKCVNGYPVSNMFPGPNCPQGWQSMPPFDPAKCKPNLPDPSDPVDMVDPYGSPFITQSIDKGDPGMQRMRDLMEYKKPK